MTDPTLSQRLDQWKIWLNTITSNLLDLTAAASTRAIRARLADPTHDFVGITRETAVRGIATLDSVVDLYDRLARVIDEASALVNKRGALRSNEERATALLEGQSLVLQAQPVAVRDRGLLEAEYPEARMTPAQALAQMERSFAEARDAVTAVADAVQHVRPRLAALNQEMARLDSLAATLGIARPAALAEVSPPLERVESDPLGCAAELTPLEDAVGRWRAELKAIDADHKAVFASLERGRGALSEFSDLLARSGAAYTEAREKIADPEGLTPPAGDEVVASLDSWLRTLVQHAASGRFAAVRVGLAQWEQVCNERLDVERVHYARNSAGLDERAELRGRYRALCAKAAALQRRGVALGGPAEAACGQGKSVLDAIPFDLRAGRRVVETLEAAVSTARR
jgi:hypothetical protein